MSVELTLYSHRAPSGILATRTIDVAGSALFGSLRDLFPGATLDRSASIVVFGSEGPGFSGSSFDPDSNSEVALIGFYGQSIGPYGAGQTLRTQAAEASSLPAAILRGHVASVERPKLRARRFERNPFLSARAASRLRVGAATR